MLHSFNFADGGDPFGGRLIRDVVGKFYATTSGGGVAYNGTVFKLDRTGNVTVLYSFTGRRGGGILCAGQIRDAAGNSIAQPSAAACLADTANRRSSRSRSQVV